MELTPSRPWRATDRGVSLAVRVTPRGGRDAIDGVEAQDDGRAVLKLRVRVAAEDGAANKAVVALLAKSLGVAKRDVSLLSGQTARVKQLAIVGVACELIERLEGLTRASPV